MGNHAISKQEEQRSCLRDRDILLDVAVQKQPDSQQSEEDIHKTLGTLNEDLAFDFLEFGSADERIREDKPSNKKRKKTPQNRDSSQRLHKHQKACCHSERRNDDLFNGNGTIACFHSDENHSECHDKHADCGAYLKNWGIQINHNSRPLSINNVTLPMPNDYSTER